MSSVATRGITRYSAQVALSTATRQTRTCTRSSQHSHPVYPSGRGVVKGDRRRSCRAGTARASKPSTAGEGFRQPMRLPAPRSKGPGLWTTCGKLGTRGETNHDLGPFTL
jgi:hypothetical protein